ncbi:MAG: thymidine phosphorylase [Anaerolineae bacterium]|nr:thymidine phosphorylase [Anaerolineae bacterium]
MRMVTLIEKKRDGNTLSTEELEFFVRDYVDGKIPDYQAAALLMAILLRGMDDRETCDLTLAMARSGETLDLKDVAPLVVDKHSTGGVGDKVSLVVAPAVAACGLPVGKMSGHGLGFSGGTLDKLESIPGYRCDLNVAEFKAQLRAIGLVLTGQSANLAPADGKLYALRDVTGTVPSLPLIVSSVMSKKIAAGADAIVLDVKVGSGAFMKTYQDAKSLAESMVKIGHLVGRQVVAHISDMNQPLGNAIGNSIEVREAIATLQGQGPADFLEHSLVIAGEMLFLGQKAATLDAGIELARQTIASGAALEKFRQFVVAQGGDVRYVDDPSLFPPAPLCEVIPAPRAGYLARLQTDEIGIAVVDLGGGRAQKGDRIDYRVGLVAHVKVGEWVEAGQPLFTVYAKAESQAAIATRRVLAAVHFSDNPVEPLPLFYERISM